jgi:hypothetical protein
MNIQRLYRGIFLRFQLHYIAIITVSLLACGGGGSQHSVLNQSSIQHCPTTRSHPDSDYLIEHSEGASLEAARAQATTELTRRLSAELRSEVTVISSTNSKSGGDQVQERVEVSSHFRHAELIKPIGQCEQCSGQVCSSAVALNRDEIAHRLLKEVNVDIKRLKESAKDLKAGSPLLRFTQAWYTAQAASQRIEPTLNQLKLIQRITPELQQIELLMNQAHQERAAREERLWIGVNPSVIDFNEQMPKLLEEGIQGRFGKAFETLGLKRWPESTCPTQEQTKDVLMITPVGQMRCSLGFLGPECRLKLGIKVDLCHEGAVAEDTWNALKIAGVHPREMTGAVNKLVRSLDQLDFSASLSKSLSPFIIL